MSRAESPAKQQKNSQATTPAVQHANTANTQPEAPGSLAKAPAVKIIGATKLAPPTSDRDKPDVGTN